MKKILVPIDFSISSEYATKLAVKIAKKSDSEIHLLHMVELPTGIIDMGAGSNFSIPKSMVYLKMIKAKLLKYKNTFFSENMTVIHSIRFQNPYEGIRDYNKKIAADLIIMGSKGLSDFEEILIGSNTEKVVRNSKTPVISVREDTENFEANTILYTSNFKSENKESFEKILNFSRLLNSKIHFLKVNTPYKFEKTPISKEKILNFIADLDLPENFTTIYNDHSVEEGILNFSNEINADLIALSTHGRSSLSHMFNSSIANNLSKNILKPMFTVKI